MCTPLPGHGYQAWSIMANVAHHLYCFIFYPSLIMDYILIERTIYDAMVSALADCHTYMYEAFNKLMRTESQEWIDNHIAQYILRRSQRGMTALRTDGKIGYSLIEGKVFYPSDEIGRILNENYENYG